MSDFGQKRPASNDVVKAKRGRPKKKPDYDKDSKIQEQLEMAVSLFSEPLDDRKKRSENAPTIASVAQVMNTTPIRVKKMLITAGYYSTAISREVQKLHNEGRTMQEIMKETGLKEASIYCYLPYSKGVYNLNDPTLYAEQGRRFRTRKRACANLKKHIDAPDAEEYLWKTIIAFENYLFQTASGLPMRYTLKGGELFFTRKEKSVTKSTVIEAFHRAREIQAREGFVNGPRKLGTFGASYLYPVFLRIGVCEKKHDEI